VLMKNVRGSDILGRLAPDEFGILLVRCDNANAWRKGKDLVATLNAALAEVHGCKPSVVVSYGAYTFSEAEDVTTGLKHAAAMLKRGTAS
jgi:GGDEF domain-containing protein